MEKIKRMESYCVNEATVETVKTESKKQIKRLLHVYLEFIRYFFCFRKDISL